MFKNIGLFLFALIFLATLGGVESYAASPAGKAVHVKGSVNVSGASGHRSLKKGGSVYQGDKISTSGFGHVEILFTDQTKLVIGSSSTMILNNYVLSSGKRARSFAVNAARGTFRFLSGRSAKRVYKIKTPVATIGIRGTKFDFATRRTGRTSVLLYQGRVRVCGSGKCRTMNRACEVIIVERKKGPRLSTSVDFASRTLNYEFPYVRSERRLTSAFRVGAERCAGSESGPKGNGSESGNKGGSDSDKGGGDSDKGGDN